MSADRGTVEDQSFFISNFRLHNGTVMPTAYPDFLDGIVPMVTAPRAQNVEQSLAEPQARLAADPEWNGGRYYDSGGAKTTLTELRVEMLKRNGIEAALARRYPDGASRETEIRKQAIGCAQRWDTNSPVILRRGTIGYDTVKAFPKIRAKVLYGCAGPTGCSRRQSRPGSCRLSPPLGSMPAISRSAAISGMRQAARNVRNGRPSCANSLNR